MVERLTYGYDLAGRLIAKTRDNGGFGQDSALTAQYDGANRMTQVTLGAKTYTLTYDVNGNLVRKENPADPADRTDYTWNIRDELTRIDGPGLTVEFKYDPLGRRIERIFNGVITQYLYDGAQAIAEIKADGTTQHLTGLGIDEVLARLGPDGARLLIADEQGSILAELAPDGAVAASYAYSPYGETSITGSSDNSLQYTGRENDGSGLYYYRARYYDPGLKRFIAEDPIGLAGGLNVYEYVGGSPTNFTDPSGNWVPAIIRLCRAFPKACEKITRPAANIIIKNFCRLFPTLCGKGCKPPAKDNSAPPPPGPKPPKPNGEEGAGPAGAPGSGPGGPGSNPSSPGNEGPNTPPANQPQQSGAGGGGSGAGESSSNGTGGSGGTTNRPSGIPDNWIEKGSKKGGGTTYINPKNPHDRVRVMPGNTKSPNPGQQGPYVKRQIDGRYYDGNGQAVPGDSPQAHIPLDQFKF